MDDVQQREVDILRIATQLMAKEHVERTSIPLDVVKRGKHAIVEYYIARAREMSAERIAQWTEDTDA